MTSLQEIENFLDIEIGDKRLRPGKKNPNKNKYYYYPDRYYIVMLTQGMWMIAEDCKKTRRLLRLFCWCRNHDYAVSSSNKHWHQMFLNYEDGLVADHINNKTYDNRSDNLRVVTQRQNLRNLSIRSDNTSGKMGVSKLINKYWRASITNIENRRISKTFSIQKFGEAEAKRQAIEWRRQKEIEFGYLGE